MMMRNATVDRGFLATCVGGSVIFGRGVSMEDCLVWRPNCFTPEQWNQLSRQEQIQWWSDMDSQIASAERASPHPLRSVERYEKGIICKAELSKAVFECLTVDNVVEFVAHCPSGLLEHLRERVAALPADNDEEGWSSLIDISGALYAPWVTDEKTRAVRNEASVRYRSGAQVLRSFLQERPNRPAGS